jgi:SAM-dependent methyltransferase
MTPAICATVPRALSHSLRALLLLAVACGCAGVAHAKSNEASVRPGANEVFLADDLDVDRFVEIFEGESREVFANRDGIVEALALSPGMAVADIGAGTGAFLPALDRHVGRTGRVYAVDISPKFLEHLRKRVKLQNLANVEVVTGLENSVELPAASVDLAFVCDTYHHFEYPQSTLASLFAAIRPGGSLVIVDFDRIPGTSRKWILDHMRAGKAEFTREIESAGFRFDREISVDGLEENYVLRFERP